MDDFFDQINQGGDNSPKNQEEKVKESTDMGQQQFKESNQQPQPNFDNFFEDVQKEEAPNSEMKQSYQMDRQFDNNYDQEPDTIQQEQTYSPSQQIPEVNKADEILRQLEEERNKKLIESQIEESKQQEELLSNAKTWLNNWRKERQQQIESRKKINRENEQTLLEAQEKQTQYKSEWDKVVHNVELKNTESTSGKEILRMKQAILGKNSDISHPNQ